MTPLERIPSASPLSIIVLDRNIKRYVHLRDDILEFLEIIGVPQKVDNYLNAIFSILESEITVEDSIELRKSFGDIRPQLINLVVEIYSKTIDEATMAKILGFYKSELGQLSISITEKIHNSMKELDPKFQEIIQKAVKGVYDRPRDSGV